MTKYARDFQSGFTLVELLVVIAIIGVLISMLVPSLGKAREGAKMIDCASRQRQVYLLAMAYREDNKYFYPACHFYRSDINNPERNFAMAFAYAIYPYMPAGMNTINSYASRPRTNILFCPSSIYNPSPLTAATVQPWVYAGNALIIGYNTAMQFGGGNIDSWTTTDLVQYGVKKELRQGYSIAYLSELSGNSPYLFYGTSGNYVKYNHFEGKSVNVTMSDGVIRGFHEPLGTAMTRAVADPKRLAIW